MSPPHDTASLAELLARIDERTKLSAEVQATILARFDDLPKTYVTLAEFRPVKSIVYGAVGLILMAVMGALIALVIVKNH